MPRIWGLSILFSCSQTNLSYKTSQSDMDRQTSENTPHLQSLTLMCYCVDDFVFMIHPIPQLTNHTIFLLNSNMNTGKMYWDVTCVKKYLIIFSKLAIHKRSHNVENLFQCSLCAKSFKRSDELTAHKRSHSGEKSF